MDFAEVMEMRMKQAIHAFINDSSFQVLVA
jgi:hypothetical protein